MKIIMIWWLQLFSDANEERQQVSLATRWGLGFSSSTRAQERPQPCLHTRRVQSGLLRDAVVKQDILIKVEPVFMSTFGCFRTIIYKQARTNLTMINYVWYQPFTIKVFISTLNVSFLSLSSPQRTWSTHKLKQIKKWQENKILLGRKSNLLYFCVEVQMFPRF